MAARERRKRLLYADRELPAEVCVNSHGGRRVVVWSPPPRSVRPALVRAARQAPRLTARRRESSINSSIPTAHWTRASRTERESAAFRHGGSPTGTCRHSRERARSVPRSQTLSASSNPTRRAPRVPVPPRLPMSGQERPCRRREGRRPSGSQASLHVAKGLHDLPVADVHEVDAPHRAFIAFAEPVAPADRCPVA
jgi:hypothetical protein